MSQDTRPGEISRIAQDEVRFRIEVLTGQARLQALLEAHIADDQRQFAELKSQYGNVTSSVNEARNAGNITIKQAFAILVTLAIAIGGWFIALWPKK